MLTSQSFCVKDEQQVTALVSLRNLKRDSAWPYLFTCAILIGTLLVLHFRFQERSAHNRQIQEGSECIIGFG